MLLRILCNCGLMYSLKPIKKRLWEWFEAIQFDNNFLIRDVSLSLVVIRSTVDGET